VKSVHFEFQDKSARAHMRMPESQLEAIRAEAEKAQPLTLAKTP
jgi:predicted DNA binding CopG/RHH family protein